MSRTRIKICGIRDIAIARSVVHAGADYLGLNFVEQSPRHVTIEQAKLICDAVRSEIEPVALFSDQSLDFVRSVLDRIAVSTVQLHGAEDRSYVQALHVPAVFKAVPFDQNRIEVWRDPPDNVAALLIDAPFRDGALTGGSGRVFDWRALGEMQRGDLPSMVLAGGLTPANVAAAIGAVRPWGVDVSSGVESSRGVKDPELIGAFCQAVRDTDAA